MATSSTATNVLVNKFMTLNLRDLLRGLLMTVLGSVIAVIVTTAEAGSLDFDWHVIKIVAISSGGGYLIKNLFTPTEVVMKDVPEKTVEAVKNDEATVKITTGPKVN